MKCAASCSRQKTYFQNIKRYILPTNCTKNVISQFFYSAIFMQDCNEQKDIIIDVVDIQFVVDHKNNFKMSVYTCYEVNDIKY